MFEILSLLLVEFRASVERTLLIGCYPFPGVLDADWLLRRCHVLHFQGQIRTEVVGEGCGGDALGTDRFGSV